MHACTPHTHTYTHARSWPSGHAACPLYLCSFFTQQPHCCPRQLSRPRRPPLCSLITGPSSLWPTVLLRLDFGSLSTPGWAMLGHAFLPPTLFPDALGPLPDCKCAECPRLAQGLADVSPKETFLGKALESRKNPAEARNRILALRLPGAGAEGESPKPSVSSAVSGRDSL